MQGAFRHRLSAAGCDSAAEPRSFDPPRVIANIRATSARRAAGWLVSAAVATGASLQSTRNAEAGCAPAPTVGADVITCDAAIAPNPAGAINFLGGNDRVTANSGTYTSFTFPSGNNTLIFGEGGGAPSVGTVTFGGGNDRMEVHSGTINFVDQGGGDDTFIMTGGQITGNLEQSGGRDTFVMSGGTITGAFIEGDIITITGGSIGSVNMNIGNNIFTMSGGTVVGDVIGFGNDDTFNLSGSGFIGGNVDLGNGNNRFTVTGGQIVGAVSAGTGTDVFTWEGGGTIGGAVNLGAGNDTATLRNLSDANLTMPSFNGGSGVDQLTFDNVTASGIARFQNWETVNVNNGSRLTFDGNLTLGDGGAGALTGTLSIDATSTVLAGNGAHPIIQPFTPGQLVTVTNAGLIDLGNGGSGATDTLTIVGNYVGASGRLALQTVLGSDGSPSDRLIVSGGTASGNTAIQVTNLGGTGAATAADGILLVQAINGATTVPGSFSLGSAAAAGAFEYLLFRGGATGANSDNWYLRSTMLVPASAVVGTSLAAFVIDPPLPLPPPPPDAPPGTVVVPLIRPEVAVQSVVPQVARRIGLVTLGTFHERQGEQMLPAGNIAPAGWGRLFGERGREQFARGVRPDFDGTFSGLQAGRDLWRFDAPGGMRDHVGVYLAHTRAQGDVRGFAIGVPNAAVGNLQLDSTSIGAYWTRIAPSGGYIDAVMQGGLIEGSPRSVRGIGTNISGFGLAASVEAGQPIPVGPWLALEPQAQVIWQHLSLDGTRDLFSTIDFGKYEVFTGRLGGRLAATINNAGAAWQPYLKSNVWWTSQGSDAVTFATDVIRTERNAGPVFEAGGGINGRLTRFISVYGTASYLTAISGERRNATSGNVGLRVSW